MKKFGILMCAFAALSLSFTSCVDPEGPNGPVGEIVEDGFYVIGEATVYQSLTDEGVTAATMSAGFNENDGNTEREGMYEKYLLLEGGKEFSLVLKEGATETTYGAELSSVDLFTTDSVGNKVGADDQPTITVQRGIMTENSTLTVPADGFYHIVLDLNKDNKLEDKQIMIAPVAYGVRGAMNGWGFTEAEASAFNAEDKTTMTFTLEDQDIAANGEFKFAYGAGWKIQLNATPADATDNTDPRIVKANTNLGANLIPGGDNVKVTEGAGLYKITLTYTLKAGSIADNFAYAVELTEASNVPTTMNMIGEEFGSWNWESDSIVEFTPVNGVAGAFWTIQYFTAAKPFKFCPNKEWNGEFTGLGTDTGYTVADGNCSVDADGLYMVYVDLVNEKLAIEPAAVYGMGDVFGGWDEANPAAAFTATDKTLTVTTAADGELRMYAASSIKTSDWWTREFNIYDGVVKFRGNDGDLEKVLVTAGQTVTLDFSNPAQTTGSIN